MAGTSNLIRTQNILRGTLNADNVIEGIVGTAYSPTYAVITETGAQIALYINSSDYKMHAELKDKFGNHLADSNVIDLPLETMVVNARYDATTKEVVLILDNGNELRFSVADLVEGLVSTEQLQEVLGDYVKFTDYATGSTGGIIKTNSSYATRVGSGGILTSIEKNYSEYTNMDNVSFISKGTLENVIAGKELVNKTYVDEADAKFEDDLFGEEVTNDEGEEITLDNTIENSYLKLDLKGNTAQESTTGKNLYDFSINETTAVGMTIKGDSNQIQLNGKNTSGYTFSCQGKTLPAGTYTYQQSYVSGTIENGAVYQIQFYINGVSTSHLRVSGNYTNDYYHSFELTEESTIQIRIYCASNSPVNATNYILNTNVISGNTPDYTYEPYTGGPSPNPDFPQEIENVSGENFIYTRGKNIIPTQWTDWESGHYEPSKGIKSTNDARVRIKDLIFVNPSTTYYVNCYSDNDRIIIREYDKEQKMVTSRGAIANKDTFETTKNTFYISISLYSQDNSTRSYQIYQEMFAKGEIKPLICLDSISDKEYESYVSKTFHINLKNKNLFDKNNANIENWLIGHSTHTVMNSSVEKSIVIEVKPNTTYTISKISTNRFRCGESSVYPKVDDVLNNYYTPSDNGTVSTITTLSTTNYLVVNIINISNVSYDLQTTLDSIQIEENDHATSYMPYTTPYDIQLSKIGNYQDSIRRSVGKNLFNDIWESGAIGTSTGQNTDNNSYKRTKNYTNVLPNTKYTFSIYQTEIQIVVFYYNEKSFINFEYIGNNSYIGFTTPDNCNNIRIRVQTENSITNTQLELGNISTEYEPYGHQFYLYKNIGDVVLDGSENWGIGNNGNWFYYNNIIFPITSGGGEITPSFNNYFLPNKYDYIYGGLIDYGFAFSYNGNRIAFRHKDITTVENFKQWLSAHNTKVQYVLQTPTYEVISEENYPILYKQLENIYNACTYKGQTSISQINEKMPFEIAATAFKATTAGKIADVNNKIEKINSNFDNVELKLTDLDIGSGVE